MADIEDLLNDVRTHAPRCPVPELEDNIRRSLIQFCRESQIWRDWMTIALTKGQAEYRLRPRAGRVEAFRTARYEDDTVGRHPLNQAAWHDAKFPEHESNARPRAIALSPDHSKAVIFPTPTAEASENPKVRAYTIFVPNRSDDTFPDFLEDDWREGLIHGALFYLHRTPKKPWTSSARAQAERFEFYTAINRAARESRTDNWAPQMTRMRKFV